MPLIPRLWTPAPEIVGVLLAEFAGPAADGLIAEYDAPGGHHQLFDVTKTQRKAEIRPNSMGNNFGGVAVPLIAWRSRVCCHA